MDPEKIQLYLSNIEEYIFDDNKIVTFGWLSKAFKIHSNVSKQLLHTFLENCQKKEELCVTHLLIGFPSDKETCQVSIVKDKDLSTFENSLKSITSKHIYSIQKSSDITDINVLYTAQKNDCDENFSKGISAIDFNYIERDNALISKLKADALPDISKKPTVASKKTISEVKNKLQSPVKSDESEQGNKLQSSENDKESVQKTENKKAVIPSMFKNSTQQKKKPAEKKSLNTKKTQDIGAFFSKKIIPSNEAKTVQSSEAKIVPSSKAKIVPSSNLIKDEIELKNKVVERLSPTKENKPTLNISDPNRNKSNAKTEDDTKESPLKPKKQTLKTKSKDVKKGPKKSSMKKNRKEDKKRKRLVVLSDSDSNNSEEDEEVRESTPEPEPTVVTENDDIIEGTPEPSRKRKKLVSKTYQTPEGYMVTEKQYVDTSCSENEEVLPEKKFKGNTPKDDQDKKQNSTTLNKLPLKAKKESPKIKAISPQKTKQSSLTNFFKKK